MTKQPEWQVHNLKEPSHGVRRREQARRAMRVLAAQPEATDASAQRARARLIESLQDDLAERITSLPAQVAATLAWPTGPADVFEPTTYSMRRFTVALWDTWLKNDRRMPSLVRALARLNGAQLFELIDGAGLVHIAQVVSIVDEDRRARVLTNLDETHVSRVLARMRSGFQSPAPRQLLKARLHELLSDVPHQPYVSWPRRPGFRAVSAMWMRFGPDEQAQLRRAWPEDVTTEVLNLMSTQEPDWSLSESVWNSLVEEVTSVNHRERQAHHDP